MWTIARKELSSFFSSPIGYMVIGTFLFVLGGIMWILPEFSILESNYATMRQLFTIAPILFVFLIPALCMRLFAEELQLGTIELLMTKPISTWKVVMGKYLAAIILLFLTLAPTIFYYVTIYQLGTPVGNLDSGQIIGSYIGLFFLGAVFAAIGVFASTLTKNQIVAFILALVLCMVLHWSFFYLSRFPGLIGFWDDVIQKIGIDYHYASMSRGVIDLKDVVYFLSVIGFFLYLSVHRLNSQYA